MSLQQSCAGSPCVVEAEFQTASLKLVGLAPAGFTPEPLRPDDSDTQDVQPNALFPLRGQGQPGRQKAWWQGWALASGSNRSPLWSPMLNLPVWHPSVFPIGDHRGGAGPPD